MFPLLFLFATSHNKDLRVIPEGGAGSLIPVGATYRRDFTVPLLGKQEVRLRIESHTTASIRLRGVFEMEDEILEYLLSDSGGLEYQLGDKLTRLLRRTRTVLHEVQYDPERDVAILVTRPLFFGIHRLELLRQDCSRPKKYPFPLAVTVLHSPTVYS